MQDPISLESIIDVHNKLKSYDKKEYRKYTAKSEFDKNIHTLEGLIKGIKIDKEINKDELLELSNWCLLNSNLEAVYPFSELIPLIKCSLEDDKLTQEEIDDILWVCDKYTSENIYYDVVTSDMQRLHGILHGILADNQITEEEIKCLKKWLVENEHMAKTFPYDEVYSLVVSVLKDGKVDNSEKETLKAFFSNFIDIKNSFNLNQNEMDTLKKEFSVGGICSICPEIEINNKLFCFTGVSKKSDRYSIAKIIDKHKGRYHDSVLKETDYLVIGDNGNPCWSFSCYGRKVEKAMNMRKSGHKIVIIHENDFWDTVADLG